MKYTLKFLDKYRDFGLLLLRVGIGGMFFLFHGLPKLTGGPALWENIGGAMAGIGVTFAPVFWGFMAALAESVGAILLMIGLYTRYALALLLFTMIMAATFHFNQGDGMNIASRAIEMGILFLSLIFIGPGKYSLDAR